MTALSVSTLYAQSDPNFAAVREFSWSDIPAPPTVAGTFDVADILGPEIEGNPVLMPPDGWPDVVVITWRSLVILRNSQVWPADPNNPAYNPSNPSTCSLNITGSGSNFLLEDCSVQYGGMVVQKYPEPGMIQNVKLRRNEFMDSYSTVSHSQGIYISGVNGLVVEGCGARHVDPRICRDCGYGVMAEVQAVWRGDLGAIMDAFRLFRVVSA